MAVLTSPKKLYKHMIPILINSHLYVMNVNYLNDEFYGNWHSKASTWRMYVTGDYATLQYEHTASELWIRKYGEDF